SLFREGAEASGDQYRALDHGQQRLFRLGMFGAVEEQIGRSKRSSDITQIFDSPRMQELLGAIIPNPEQASRFGGILNTEKSFVRTRNEVLGNSKTAERQQDDATLNQVHGLIGRLRATRSLSEAAFQGTQKMLDMVFGFRADTAAAVARKLMTADR